MNYNQTIQGKVVFDPEILTHKHNLQSEWKKNVIVIVNEPDFCNYFGWFIKKRYNLKIVEPLRGVHLTIVNDRLSDGVCASELKYNRSKQLFNNKTIDIQYNTDVRTDGKYWWFKAKSNEAILIRQHIGLNPISYFDFHITVGRVEGREFEKEHGRYIHNLIKKSREYGINS